MIHLCEVSVIPQPKLQIIAGRSHPAIAKEIADVLGVKLCAIELNNFANGEVSAKFQESVRGDDLFVIQSHTGNVNDSIIEQAILIDCAKRASAASITAVCPFMAYARQDRKSSGREPITARLVIDLLAKAGANRIMSVDLHAGQIQGFFDGPFDHLIARPILVDYVASNFSKKDLVIVSPDAGRVKSAECYSSELGCGMAIVHKHRSTSKHNAVEARQLIGEVQGKICILIDDMIDTAGTMCSAADMVMRHGAKEVYGLATHGILSDPANERINASLFKNVIITNTIPQDNSSDKITVLSVGPLIAQAISAVHSGDSVSAIFNGGNQI